MELVNIYQVYYKESQLASIEHIPYYNDNCTPYFENSVIVDLINSDAHRQSKYFGVLSHKFRTKIEERKQSNWSHLPNFANTSRAEFSPRQIDFVLDRFNFPVLNLMQHPSHDPVSYGNKFHANLSHFFAYVLKEIGYDWKPCVIENVFYSNYFIAKSEIYEHYVKSMLEPAIKVMDKMPELWSNSGYSFELPIELQNKWGVKHYPYHSFVLERLFSYYCHVNQIKI
jgi:hypothetical protein